MSGDDPFVVHLPDGKIIIEGDYGPNLGPRVIVNLGLVTLPVPADKIDDVIMGLTMSKDYARSMERSHKQHTLPGVEKDHS